MTKGYMTWLIAIALAIAPTIHARQGQAGEHHQHGPHEHGVAHLNVALEGNNLYIEFFSPAMNIVGFEHHPGTQAQKDAVKKAGKNLKAGEKLFHLARKAQARLAKSRVETDIDRDSGHESHTGKAHEQDKNSGNAHNQDNAPGHEHHSDYKAEYHFICERPEKLAYMDVMLLRFFPGIERMEVQILTGAGQAARQLKAGDDRIHF